MSGTYKTSEIYFKPVKLSIATIHFPLIEIKSPFPIFTLETMVLSRSLKSFMSLVIWFVQPLSINHESLELLLVAKHVAVKSCSSSCSSGLDFHIRYAFPILPQFLHLTSGLHQHFLWGWFIFLKCRQEGKVSPCCLLEPSGFLFLHLLFFLSLPPLEFCVFIWKAPCTASSCLIILLYFCAYRAFFSSPKVMVDKSFDSSNANIFNSYFLGTVTRIFCTILSSGKSFPRSFTLFSMPNSRLA